LAKGVEAAIARGWQVVVVGDPEQLPPTNVGDRGVDDIEDGTDVSDQESILDKCLATNIPRRNLDWHYRSRHESLIAFSNSRYYGGRLVTFPSSVTNDRAVRLVHVPDGLYERGSSNRVNRPEARAVVADVARRLKDPAFKNERLSLGVVTFNADQQRLIEDLLDAERRAHPDLEPFLGKERRYESVFVKNLENVQGDERDAIIFSVAVGPDAAGRVSTTVSSLNKEGGHRRLNFAVTRARRELVVFTSLRPEQIDLGRTGSRGVRDFKHFLEFADRGSRALAEVAAPTGQDTESPLEDAVTAALAARGWVIHPQVGVSGFRIDLGVVHPDEPGRYLAGVECDGATYHRSATARDRDRLREMVLTGLGWRIRRVWSTEWWASGGSGAR
jgi:superfamily I DNA and/or RNA helicase